MVSTDTTGESRQRSRSFPCIEKWKVKEEILETNGYKGTTDFAFTVLSEPIIFV